MEKPPSASKVIDFVLSQPDTLGFWQDLPSGLRSTLIHCDSENRLGQFIKTNLGELLKTSPYEASYYIQYISSIEEIRHYTKTILKTHSLHYPVNNSFKNNLFSYLSSKEIEENFQACFNYFPKETIMSISDEFVENNFRDLSLKIKKTKEIGRWYNKRTVSNPNYGHLYSRWVGIMESKFIDLNGEI